MKIRPLAITTFDWQAFDSFVIEAIQTSPIRFLDSNRITPGNLPAWIVSLEYFFSNGYEKPIHLEDAKVSLDHVSVTFSIECTDFEAEAFKDLYIRKHTHLRNIHHREIKAYILLSGTLKEWKENVIACCSDQVEPSKRKVFNEIYEWFKQIHLVNLFADYSLRSLKDSTFALELNV